MNTLPTVPALYHITPISSVPIANRPAACWDTHRASLWDWESSHGTSCNHLKYTYQEVPSSLNRMEGRYSLKQTVWSGNPRCQGSGINQCSEGKSKPGRQSVGSQSTLQHSKGRHSKERQTKFSTGGSKAVLTLCAKKK